MPVAVFWTNPRRGREAGVCAIVAAVLTTWCLCVHRRSQSGLDRGQWTPSSWRFKPILHQSRTAHRARRNTCKLSQPMDATVQHCPATVPAVTGIDRPKLGQRRSSGHTVHTTDEARTALRLSKLRSIKIFYTLTMIYDSLYI